jgi:dTDP-4-dehydrorhamnose 3,5-epimerase
MRFTDVGIPGAKVIDPEPHNDARGRFLRAWCVREFADQGIDFAPLQANLGRSLAKGTIRGMHFQEAPASEAKLVRCTKGAIFDVVLDIRPDSPSFGRWHGVELTADNARMLYLPVGCAHGYQTLEPATELYYMTSALYAPGAARGVRFNDPAFGIEWPLPAAAVSEQDRTWPLVGRSPRQSFAIADTFSA